jgi:hypothetical protein
VGKTRHIDTSFLWVQEKNASKEIRYGKISGKENPADLFTKFLSGEEIGKHMQTLNVEFKTGTDDIALSIGQLSIRSRGSANRWTSSSTKHERCII